MSDIAIGTFSFPTPLLLFFAAVIAATAIGNWLARGNQANVERATWIVIGLSLLIARIAFVLRY